jgi:hypothetical protein
MAMRTAEGCSNVDFPIELGWRRAAPTRMSDGNAFLFCRLIRWRFGRGDDLLGIRLLFLAGREPVLPLKLQFQLCLCQIGIKFSILLNQISDLIASGIDGAGGVAVVFHVNVSTEHPHGNRGTAGVWTMSDTGARTVFEGIRRVARKKFVGDICKLSAPARIHQGRFRPFFPTQPLHR